MAERLKPEHKDRPGYEGYLNDRVVTLPEILRDGGYETLMSGKWHLGLTQDRTPYARGFERSYSLLCGCHNHYGWEPAYEDRSSVPRIAAGLRRIYQEDDRPLEPSDLPKDFYSSDSFTTKLLSYLEDRSTRNETRPFFAYLPFSAPHWPLQAPKENIDRYQHVYDDGFEVLRQKRLARLKELGLVPKEAVPAPVISKAEDGSDTPTWSEMSDSERAYSARTMEAYAGAVDRMDENIGRVTSYLQETNQLDNTLVLFLSDNGAEGAQFEAEPLIAGGDMKAHIAKYHNNSLENIGNFDSFAWYGARWASASTAPGLLYKMYTSEGGIRVPLIARYPRLFPQGGKPQPSKSKDHPGAIDHSFATVMDLLPTILSLTSLEHPFPTYRSRAIAPVSGVSWLPYLTSQTSQIHTSESITGWELFGRRALRRGQWKILYIPPPHGTGRWMLYDVVDDWGETRDLGAKKPEVLKEMVALWAEWAGRNGVLWEGEKAALLEKEREEAKL